MSDVMRIEVSGDPTHTIIQPCPDCKTELTFPKGVYSAALCTGCREWVAFSRAAVYDLKVIS